MDLKNEQVYNNLKTLWFGNLPNSCKFLFQHEKPKTRLSFQSDSFQPNSFQPNSFQPSCVLEHTVWRSYEKAMGAAIQTDFRNEIDFAKFCKFYIQHNV